MVEGEEVPEIRKTHLDHAENIVIPKDEAQINIQRMSMILTDTVQDIHNQASKIADEFGVDINARF